MKTISDAAKQERAAYMREYRRKNPEKTKEINRRYWENRAKKKAVENESAKWKTCG